MTTVLPNWGEPRRRRRSAAPPAPAAEPVGALLVDASDAVAPVAAPEVAAPEVPAAPPVVPHQALPAGTPTAGEPFAPAEPPVASVPAQSFPAEPALPQAFASPEPPLAAVEPSWPSAAVLAVPGPLSPDDASPWAVSPAPSPPPVAPSSSTPLVPAAVALGLVGVVGGYAAGRWAGLSAVGLLGVVWWLGSAAALSLLARRAAATTVAVTLFLFTFVATPLAVGATARGLAERAVAALEGAFEDVTTDFSDELESSFGEGLEPLPAG